MWKKLLFLTILVVGVVWAGPSFWTLNQTPTAEVFNGISAPNNNFAIAVGENGTIVHFKNGDNGTIVPSGTTKELFDVYAASENFAVASGEDVVLLWDGSTWSTIVDGGNNGTFYTGTWASPAEDVVWFQSLGQFNFLCPEIPGASEQPFCRAFSQPMLTACGVSNDVKFITAAGDVHNVNNLLGDLNGFAPLHDEPIPLFLTGVWVPPDACLPGPLEPLSMYAVRNTNQIWRFDGAEWSNMNVLIPGDQTLSWIGGINDEKVLAVGFKPDGQGGNQGVVWVYDGQSWTEDTNLPANTPGLTDIAANVQPADFIFANGFDNTVTRGGFGSQGQVDILAVAESGKYISSNTLFPAANLDLRINKRLISPQPIRVGDRIEFRIVIQNVGDTAAIDFRFLDGYDGVTIQLVADNCGMQKFNVQSGWRYRDTRVASLAAGGVMVCTMEFDAIAEGELYNYAAIAETDETNYDNNRSVVRNIDILPAQ
ncbi:hypothetical protein [Marinicella sp. W31]|uniref:hypothetical protein n=1 Tax=Marinicella sp. W31 TaxID=3023713 RepID=UPI0037579CA9